MTGVSYIVFEDIPLERFATVLTVPEMLRECAATYEERNKLYGDNYKYFGHVAAPLLSNMHVETPHDFNRLGILIQIISKLTRYCEQLNAGGHDDSLLDLAVYVTMLRELDADARKEQS